MSAPRAAVLRALAGVGEAVTVTALADDLGQHPNTVREHLDRLVADGHVERLRSRPVGRGRPAWLYRLVGPAGVDGIGDGDAVGDGGQEYAALAVALIDQVVSTNPDPRAMARRAGERWGRTLVEQRSAHGGNPDRVDPVAGDPADRRTAGGGIGSGVAADPAGVVVDLLADLRFEPEPAAEPGTVRLTACPLLDAARRNPDVVCEVHLGIVRGALDLLGGDPDGAGLEAFAEPGACRLRLPAGR